MKRFIDKPKAFYIKISILTIFLVAFFIYSSNNSLEVTEQVIKSPKIITPIKIALITDLHSCDYGEKQKELMDNIKSNNVDIVMLGGDIVDDEMPQTKSKELFEELSNKYPSYYVAGNHEYMTGSIGEIKSMIRSYGINVLEGTSSIASIKDQNIQISGIDDPENREELFRSELDSLSASDSMFSILLSHRPERINDYLPYNFDLVLAGHSHGGQWRIPYVLDNGLLAPGQGLFPSNTSGIFDFGNTNLIVSRGLSRESTIIPRIFNKPELVIITLEPK